MSVGKKNFISLKNNVNSYGWRNVIGPHHHAFITPKITDILKSICVNRIVDIGSGNGFLCGHLKKKGFYVIGIEPDKSGIEISRETYPDIKFYNLGVEASPDDIPLSEAPFDAVVSTEVIEHLYSPHHLLIMAYALLKDNGYVIVSTPYHGFLKNLALSLANKWDSHHTALWHGGHIKFWSRKTLTMLFKDNGFKVEGFFGVGRLPYLWKSMILVGRKLSKN